MTNNGHFSRLAGRIIGALLSIGFLINKKDRVRVELVDREGRILCIKNQFSDQKWTLPGGGVKRGESYSRAAQRELLEELGVNIPIENLTFVRRRRFKESFLPFWARVYQAEVDRGVVINPNFEIISYEWRVDYETIE